MDKVFLQILNMNIIASYTILFVLGIRLLLRKMPRVFSYLLWGVVLFRLICPFSFESVLSVLPVNTDTISQTVIYEPVPKISSTSNFAESNDLPLVPREQGNRVPSGVMETLLFAAPMVWILGIVILMFHSMASVMVLRKKIKSSSLLRDNIYKSSVIATPFVFGILTPRIYIPESIREEEMKYIIRHEQIHIKRLDHMIKPLSFLVVCVHWFNPLVWLAFICMSRDMELSCDERVIKEMGNEIKEDYSASLLALSSGRTTPGGNLAFGKNGVKLRIKNILNYKKPAFIMGIIAAIIVGTVSLGLISNPKEKKQEKEEIEQVADNKQVGTIEETEDVSAPVQIEEAPVENKIEGFVVYEDKDYGWSIRRSGNENTYNTPLKRYELVRTSHLDGEELILDDCLWEMGNDITETPIVFTGERFLYRAAAEDTHLAAKAPCLVSINTDGSDRRTFEPQYLTARSLCYDGGKIYYEGWTNDQAFPRPVYSINPDFTDQRLIEKIDGNMICVYENCMYYLGTGDDKWGIYMISLDDGKEPQIYDKVAYNAYDWETKAVKYYQEESGSRRTYADILFISKEDYRTTESWKLPLYGHE